MNTRRHVGVQMLSPGATGSMIIAYRECWCGAMWFAPPGSPAEMRPGGYDPMALWCPAAPSGPDTLPIKGMLMISVQKSDTQVPAPAFYVRVHNRGLSVPLATFETKGRALLVGHAFYRAFGGSHGWAEMLTRELQHNR